MNYEQKYKEALMWMRKLYPSFEGWVKEDAEHYFPELKESEDEKIRKALKQGFFEYGNSFTTFGGIKVEDIIAWLEKQGEQTNPHSGTSFEYNGHIWGMCARDNGVDILLDKQLFKHLEKQGDNKESNDEH